MKAPFKILISVLALGVMASTPLVRAQDDKAPAAEGRKGGKGGGPGGGGGRAQMMNPDARVAAIDKAVGGLSADQTAKIKAIYAKAQEEGQAMRGGGGGDREAMRAKMQEMMKATNDQVRAVLTADQQAKFDAMPQGRGPGGQGGQGGGQGRKKKDGN